MELPFREHLLDALLLRGQLHLGAPTADQFVLARPVHRQQGWGRVAVLRQLLEPRPEPGGREKDDGREREKVRNVEGEIQTESESEKVFSAAV